LWVGTQGADVHQALHPRFFHGAGDFSGQIHVHAFKALFTAVQNRHQIDHHIMAGHQAGQIRFLVNIGLNHRQPGQTLHAGRVQGAAGGHGDVNA
jgi:hypothetical protein